MPVHEMIDLCREAAKINFSCKYREGNVVRLPESGKIVLAGDLHGHRRNFERICTFADLANNPETHVVLQEILHGGPEDGSGGCLSFQLFFDILKYQAEFPEQVHLIVGNHDTAVITDSDVLKGGKEMNQSLKAAMKRCLDGQYEPVMEELKHYLLSQPLAVRTPNRIWMSHSLPADRFVDRFDPGIFERKKFTLKDCVKPHEVYTLTWGRRHRQDTLDKMAEMLDVDLFVLGHQPQDEGWSKPGDNLIILASEHNHGCIMSFDLDRAYGIEELIECIRPLASIA